MKAQKLCIMEILGLAKVRKLSVKICRDRVRFLNKNIDAGTYDHSRSLLDYAIYYRNWYDWQAKNGGTRSKAAA